MAITRVQRVCNNSISATNQASISGTVPAGGVTLGNHLIVAVGFGGVTSRDITGSDSDGNTYQTDARADKTTYQTPHVVLLSSHVTAALESGDTITMTFDGGTVNYPLLIVYEYSGLDPTDWVDVFADDIGQSAAPDSGSETTTVADSLLVGARCWQTDGGVYTAGDGYEKLHEATNTTKRLAFEEDIVSATGSYNADGSISSTDWAQVMVAYSQAGEAEPVPGTYAPQNWQSHRWYGGQPIA